MKGDEALNWVLAGMVVWQDMAGAFWLLGVLSVLLFNGGGLVFSAMMERRLEQRLANVTGPAAGILLLAGPLPPGLTGTPHLLTASVVLSPPLLGRLSQRLRRLIGGYSVNGVRLLEQARREALLRLREQAAKIGATVLAGVEMHHVEFGDSRAALLATGTAIVGGDSPLVSTSRRMTEAAGTLGLRPWRYLIVALGLVLALTLGATLAGDWMERRLMDGSLPWEMPAPLKAWRKGH